MFRKEVIDAQQTQTYGKTLKIKPLKYIELTAIVSLFIIILIIFIFSFEYDIKTKVNGYLSPKNGLTHILAQTTGTVSKVNYSIGDIIQKGDVIIELINNNVLNSGKKLYEESMIEMEKQKKYLIQKLKLEDENYKFSAINHNRIISTQNEQLKLIDSEHETIKLELEACNKLLEITKKYKLKKIISEKEFLIESRQCFELKKQLNHNLQNTLATKDIVSKSQQEIDQAEYRHTQALTEIQYKISLHHQSMLSQESRYKLNITAPNDGKIISINVKPGDYVQNNQMTVITAQNNYELKGYIYAPTQTRARIKLNQKINIKFDAFPYQKFGLGSAKIKRISETIVKTEKIQIPLKNTQNYYQVEIELDHQFVNKSNPELKLTNGMNIIAEIPYDKRPIWQWIFKKDTNQ